MRLSGWCQLDSVAVATGLVSVRFRRQQAEPSGDFLASLRVRRRWSIRHCDWYGSTAPGKGPWKRFMAPCDSRPRSYTSTKAIRSCPPTRGQLGPCSKAIKSVVSGRREEFAFEYSRDDTGASRWYRLTATPYRKDGGPRRALVLRFDETDDKLDRSRQSLYTYALKRSTEFVGILESSGEFVYANDRLCGTLGYSFRDLIGRHIWDIDPNFPRDAFQSALSELRQLGTLAIESHFRTVEGLAFPVEVTLSHYEGASGENVMLFGREPTSAGDLASGSFRFQQKVAERTSELAAANSRLQEEIVSHRQTEEELRTSQQRLALALWGTSLGLWDWSLRDGAMTFDERWCAMLGYQIDDIEPRLEGWTGLVHRTTICRCARRSRNTSRAARTSSSRFIASTTRTASTGGSWPADGWRSATTTELRCGSLALCRTSLSASSSRSSCSSRRRWRRSGSWLAGSRTTSTTY